jgi:hypothetical protein
MRAIPLESPAATNVLIRIIAKSLLVGAVYAAALAIGGLLAAMLGFSLPGAKDPLARLLWAFAGGVIMGLALGPIAAYMPAPQRRHFVIWTSLILLNIASVVIEGSFFAPQLIGNALPVLLVQQSLAALAAGWAITALFAAQAGGVSHSLPPRSSFSWTWRFTASALVYVMFYFIFGAINWILVTRPYYETHAGGLVVPPVGVTLQAEMIRGALIALSVLPFLLTLRASRRRQALLTGFVLFAIGGLVPLTMQIGALPIVLLGASAAEIFFQNFSTGVVDSHLLAKGG